MATRSTTNKESQQQDSQVERMLRINIQGITYEAVLSADPVIIVYGEPMGDKEIELSIDDMEMLSDFFNEALDAADDQQGDDTQVSEQIQNRGRSIGRRSQEASNRPQASNGDDDRQAGGQGRVKDPEHDGRLKGNEAERPGAREQAESGRRPGARTATRRSTRNTNR